MTIQEQINRNRLIMSRLTCALGVGIALAFLGAVVLGLLGDGGLGECQRSSASFQTCFATLNP